MQLLDGKTLSQKILDDLRLKISDLPVKPNLDIIIIGDDPASLKYVDMKQKKASDLGIGGEVHHLPLDTTQDDVLDLIDTLNNDPSVTAFMVQLPLPSEFDRNLIVNSINPLKDADGLTAINLGKLFHSDPSALIPATALGIIKLLSEYNIDLAGKNISIVNDSPIIGLPLLALFDQSHATVTVCHKFTQNLKEITSQSDILVTATGVKKLITSDFVKENAVVIDVSGDVDFENVKDKCSFITPPLGGVGPMTIASLLQNTYNIFIKTS